MTANAPNSGPGEPRLDVASVQSDDTLLDLLGQGEVPDSDDELVAMLAAWRADLDEPPPPPVSTPARRVRRIGRLARTVIGVAAGLVLLAGLAIGSGSAGPDSPLWPITRVVHPEQANIRAAEHAIALARTASDPDEARRLLDEAARYVAQISDPETARRLQAEIDRLRASLPSVGGGAPESPPSPPAPSTGSPTPSRSPEQPGAPGGGVLPGQPLPTPGLPLPSPPLPTPGLPGLPLPTLPSLPPILP